jgi:hypothetical protein
MKNYYKVLGLPTDAKPEEIKKAYEVLSKQYAPDNNKGDKYAEERFIDISIALKTLTDIEKRKDYDKILADIQTGIETEDIKSEADDMGTTERPRLVYFIPFLLIISVAVFAVYAILNRKDAGKSERLVFNDTTSNVSKPRADEDSNVVTTLPADTAAAPAPEQPVATIKEESKTNKTNAGKPVPGKTTAIVNKDTEQTTPVEVAVKTEGLFIGAGKNHVLNVQGTPSSIVKYENNSEMWYFGKSTIYFAGNKVSGYRNEDDNLILSK